MLLIQCRAKTCAQPLLACTNHSQHMEANDYWLLIYWWGSESSRLLKYTRTHKLFCLWWYVWFVAALAESQMTLSQHVLSHRQPLMEKFLHWHLWIHARVRASRTLLNKRHLMVTTMTPSILTTIPPSVSENRGPGLARWFTLADTLPILATDRLWWHVAHCELPSKNVHFYGDTAYHLYVHR